MVRPLLLSSDDERFGVGLLSSEMVVFPRSNLGGYGRRIQISDERAWWQLRDDVLGMDRTKSSRGILMEDGWN